jgi:hypothetical protein
MLTGWLSISCSTFSSAVRWRFCTGVLSPGRALRVARRIRSVIHDGGQIGYVAQQQARSHLQLRCTSN